MGFGSLGFLLVLTLFFRPLPCQQPNTDGSFVLDFLEKMGLTSSQVYNFSIPFCSWPGVFCDAKEENVVGLVASGLGLSGLIPDTTIGKLSKLQSLDLSNNKITGLSSDFWSLGSLKALNLSSNLISGSLPSNIGNFGVLEILDLSNNNFSGEIPAAISSLASLQVLKLDHNGFEWNIPLGILNCQSLVSMDLSFNRFNGTVPDGFVLNISRNQFQGSVMAVFQEPLQVIDLSKNHFQGHISQAQNLKYLNLAHNRFSEQEFPQIGMLFSLEYLNLSETRLTVPLPSIKNLQIFDISHNNLSGEIPLSLLEKLPWMERFNFSYNNLSLCSSEFSQETLQTSFLGSTDSCPIAANPAFFKKKTPRHDGLKLALVLTLSMICLFVGLLFLAFGCRRKTTMWAVKQLSYKEEQTISGPFSFQTDSTTWVADVKLATSVPVRISTWWDSCSSKVLVHGFTMTDQEAARELEHLGRIKHPNLVPLTGYCLAGDQRIAIYEYMENGNLQNLLHDLPLGVQTTEDWSTDTWEEDDNHGIQNVGSEGLLTTWRFRHKIVLGTARALAFLHHGCSPPIIHRDVKASSVYLDTNLEPRLSDFGLAKIVGSGLEDDISRGSQGYMPPELSDPESGTPTPKSDVYGFGVVLLELITGKKPIGDDYPEKESSLVNWVRGLVRKNQGSRAIDPKIRGTGPDAQMEEALKIGYLCTADLPSKRPSMQQIVGLLKDIEPVAHR
ncbi:putative LRR receptor-like serine/threonine-protein kinase [Vitis vinifera]|uniref:Putative LRR receptor-like serine/threonine-protein kinase n=1 Tax=Vitis vinifera TaxID=29760 RepID=A0A438GN24_VITVI|nr:putative LRR receptor-like serine/threonine-protein kinase [Vitis vinifera]